MTLCPKKFVYSRTGLNPGLLCSAVSFIAVFSEAEFYTLRRPIGVIVVNRMPAGYVLFGKHIAGENKALLPESQVLVG